MISKIISVILLSLCVTGCMGRNALTAKVTKFNLETAESRWGREGLFLGLWIVPVYPISTILDLLVFNSIEFWTGENNINGKSPIVDLPMDEVEKLGFINVKKAQLKRLSSTDAKLILDFENGDVVTFDVTRIENNYSISYRGVDFHHGTIN